MSRPKARHVRTSENGQRPLTPEVRLSAPQSSARTHSLLDTLADGVDDALLSGRLIRVRSGLGEVRDVAEDSLDGVDRGLVLRLHGSLEAVTEGDLRGRLVSSAEESRGVQGTHSGGGLTKGTGEHGGDEVW